MSKRERKRDVFREWLSDNLRYIILTVCVLAALIALFFGVRAISGRMKDSAKEETRNTEGIISSVNTAGSVKETDSVTSAADGEAAPSQSQNNAGEAMTPSKVGDVVELIRSYYTALGTQNVPELLRITDIVSESEAASISSSKGSYKDMEVYTKEGPDENSYVVYAYYRYTGDDGAEYPGLSQMFVRRGSDGSWKVVFSELDDATASYISNTTKGEDVQALIAKVRTEYETASAAAASQSENSTAG